MAISWKKINEDKKKEKVQISVKFITHMFLVIIAYVLRNEFKFGKERIFKCLNCINVIFDDVHYKRITIKDLEEVLKKEVKVIIE